MEVRVDRVEADCIGLHWTEIDVDSLTNLRRLMELNYGGAGEFGRELAGLGRQR